MFASYHVHSRWSDGVGEIVDIVRAAQETGLGEVGLSDHYVLAPDGMRMNWSMPLDELSDYVLAVRSAREEVGNKIIVRLGLEADFFPETVGEARSLIAEYPFDYVIGSVHFLDGFPIDENAQNWERLTQAERDDVIRGYWVRVRQMAESEVFDIAGHLDLTKKFGFYPSADVSAETSAALDAIAAVGMAVEVNAAGWYAPCGEAYPAPSILRACSTRDIPAVVTSDAHASEHLVRGFEDAFRLVRESGYTSTAYYAGRRRTIHALPAL